MSYLLKFLYMCRVNLMQQYVTHDSFCPLKSAFNCLLYCAFKSVCTGAKELNICFVTLLGEVLIARKLRKLSNNRIPECSSESAWYN